MNQILYIEKQKTSDNSNINRIALISAIIIIIFGVFMIGKGVFGMINYAKEANAQDPVVNIREVDEKLELQISHNKTIDKAKYFWDDEEEKVLFGRGQSSLKEIIDLPIGNHVLHLEVSDIDGHTTTYTKSYSKIEAADTKEPNIEIIMEGSKAKLVVRDDKELASVSYYWDDEDETVLTPRGEVKNVIEERISILEGQHVLTIIAKDTAGNEKKAEVEYKGARKPVITVTKESDGIFIRVTDEENVKKIDMNVDGSEFSTDNENTGASLDMQVVEFKQTLQPGDHIITITAYNVSGLSSQETHNITIN